MKHWIKLFLAAVGVGLLTAIACESSYNIAAEEFAKKLISYAKENPDETFEAFIQECSTED